MKVILTMPLFLTLVLVSANVIAIDSDADGVVDTLDKCPHTAQLIKLPADFIFGVAVNPERLKPGPKAFPVDVNGCEFDSDGDGIFNSQDYCPEDSAKALSRGVAENGCPKQSDADGTPDYRDRCPDTPKGVRVDSFGCRLDSETFSVSGQE